MISKRMIIAIVIALAFNLLDFISGFIKACSQRKLSSTKMRKGIFHKIGFILLYALCVLLHIANQELNLNLPFNLLYVITSYVILTEMISILENIGKINPEIDVNKLKQEIESKS